MSEHHEFQRIAWRIEQSQASQAEESANHYEAIHTKFMQIYEQIEKRFDALEQRMMLDRIAAASHIRSKTLGLPAGRRRKSKHKGRARAK